MRMRLLKCLVVIVASASLAPSQALKQEPKGGQKQTAAADWTRTKSLKTPVTREFTDERLGDILKEFAAQVDMKTDKPVLWTYGTGFPYGKKVTYAAKDKPLEEALDELLTKAGVGLGYVVISREGDKHDGWVRLTTTGERGQELPPPTAQEEKDAADKLTEAKKLLDARKDVSAKVFLELVVKKYPATKAAKEAKELLARIEK
jgi:hypothetical protein